MLSWAEVFPRQAVLVFCSVWTVLLCEPGHNTFCLWIELPLTYRSMVIIRSPKWLYLTEKAPGSTPESTRIFFWEWFTSRKFTDENTQAQHSHYTSSFLERGFASNYTEGLTGVLPVTNSRRLLARDQGSQRPSFADTREFLAPRGALSSSLPSALLVAARFQKLFSSSVFYS